MNIDPYYGLNSITSIFIHIQKGVVCTASMHACIYYVSFGADDDQPPSGNVGNSLHLLHTGWDAVILYDWPREQQTLCFIELSPHMQ